MNPYRRSLNHRVLLFISPTNTTDTPRPTRSLPPAAVVKSGASPKMREPAPATQAPIVTL